MKNPLVKIKFKRYLQSLFSALLLISLMTVQVSCKKSSNVDTTVPVSNPITKDSISGFLKGTMLANKTYYVKGDIWVKSTDTLAIQPGVTVIVLGNPDAAPPLIYTIHISGTLLAEGTKSSQLQILYGPKDTGAGSSVTPWQKWSGWYGLISVIPEDRTFPAVHSLLFL